jgi:uncharacterized membrane protein YgdD (TMEM256/DUF423 family)
MPPRVDLSLPASSIQSSSWHRLGREWLRNAHVAAIGLSVLVLVITMAYDMRLSTGSESSERWLTSVAMLLAVAALMAAIASNALRCALVDCRFVWISFASFLFATGVAIVALEILLTKDSLVIRPFTWIPVHGYLVVMCSIELAGGVALVRLSWKLPLRSHSRCLVARTLLCIGIVLWLGSIIAVTLPQTFMLDVSDLVLVACFVIFSLPLVALLCSTPWLLADVERRQRRRLENRQEVAVSATYTCPICGVRQQTCGTRHVCGSCGSRVRFFLSEPLCMRCHHSLRWRIDGICLECGQSNHQCETELPRCSESKVDDDAVQIAPQINAAA